jgi:hypothetical protein
MITTDTFANVVAGFPVAQVAVRSGNALCLLLREDYTQWTDYREEGNSPAEEQLEKRLVGVFLDDPDNWSWAALQGFDLASVGGCQLPQEKAVVASMAGTVYGTGSGAKGMEAPLDKGPNALRGGLLRLKTIGGHLYACGGNRSFARRDGVGAWRWFSDRFPTPGRNEFDLPAPAGFRDADGFSPSEIYLVGGEGDVWHFDGERAERIDFPSNVPLFSVCCGGDGQVYVGGSQGQLFAGRGDSWRVIKTETQGLPLMQLAWHDDRLWATNDTGLWTLRNGALQAGDLPASARVAAGSLAAADGVLLVGGRYGAAFHKDGVWTSLFNYPEMLRQCEAEGKLKSVLRTRWREFSHG